MEVLQSFWGAVQKIFTDSGFGVASWQNYVMIGIACFLLYLAIVKKFEPLLLLPIAFGMLLANIPSAAPSDMVYHPELWEMLVDSAGHQYIDYGRILKEGGLIDILYMGVKLGVYPPLIFLGIGAMTDFGPLIARPSSFILGAAAQLGIFAAFFAALAFGMDAASAGSIGIIGGADGPTAIYVTKTLKPELLGPIAVAAYSYMALIPFIQPPFMKLLTTKKQRSVVMGQLRQVSRTEKIIFPIAVTIVVCMLVPAATPLVGMLMLGNLMKESGVVDRITKTAQNELMNIITIFLGISVGATTNGTTFLNWDTLKVVAVGLAAFIVGTCGGVLFGDLMYFLSHGKINPLIGSAGVSAVPMAARVSQKVGQEENPSNYLLMHAMGPNVAGVIGSAVAAGILLTMIGH